MTTYTAYLTHTTGANLYAKAYTDGAPWATGVINGTEGLGKRYSFTLDSDTEYAVYERATGTPLESDTHLGDFGKVAATATAVSSINLTFTPATGTLVNRGSGTNLSCRTTELHPFVVNVVDAAGEDVDFTGLSLELVFESGATEVVILNADITKSNGSFGFTTTSALTTTERLWKWALRKTTSEIVMVEGTLEVTYAPNN